jgi:hypothetical protein
MMLQEDQQYCTKMRFKIFAVHQISESSRTRSEKKCCLNVLSSGCHLLQNSLLGNVYSDPIFFFSLFKSTVEVIFLNAVEYRLRFPLDVRHCFKTSSLRFHFQFANKAKSQGAEFARVGRMENDNYVVSYELCSCLGEGASFGCENFQVFSLHIFSEASQIVTVKVSVDSSVRRNKFTAKSPFTSEKQWEWSSLNSGRATPFLFWWLWAVPLWRLLLCFGIITVNPTFVDNEEN